MSFKRPCPSARYNRTNYFYPTFSENSEHSHLLVSPVLVACLVIGVVIIISCITIIVGSLRKERQAQGQQNLQLQQPYRRRRRRYQEYELDQVSDGLINSHTSHGMRYACNLAEDWPHPLDPSLGGELDATVLHRLYPDSPPGYEECVGPGATQLYLPTDAPPPYSLNGLLDTGSSRSPGRFQQAQRILGQSDLCTISMDTLPSYEAVCGASPSSGLLPLPGLVLGPWSSQDPPSPSLTLVSSPERIVAKKHITTLPLTG